MGLFSPPKRLDGHSSDETTLFRTFGEHSNLTFQFNVCKIIKLNVPLTFAEPGKKNNIFNPLMCLV